MSIKEGQTSVSYRIGENFSKDFDILQNVDLYNRVTDTGFTEFNEMSIGPRAGTTLVGDRITGGTGGVYNQVFFTDFYKKQYHLKIYNKKVYELINDTWTEISGLSFTDNKVKTATFTLPYNLDGSISTQYTTPSDSSAGERVKKDSNDSLGNNAVGKYLIILDNNGNKQSYRGIYASIIDYDSGNSEYILNGSGILVALKSGAKYAIYDTLGEYLQLNSGKDYDKYLYGKSDGSLAVNTDFEGLATKSLRLIKALQDTEFVYINLMYYGSVWTFAKNTLFFSGGTINNPFWYNLTNSLTVPGNIPGIITDLFLFKDRLIIAGDIYSAYLQGPVQGLTPIKLITQNFGMLAGTLIDLGVDAFYITNTNKIYSLKETSLGNSLYATDEGKIMRNYLLDFKQNIVGGFDGNKIYYYGEDSTGKGATIVFDIQYKFWSTYEGLKISSIVNNKGITYISDNDSDIVRKLDNSVQSDMGVAFEQYITTKNIYFDNPFSIKELGDCMLWLDNYEQSLKIELYSALASSNSRVSSKNVNIFNSDLGTQLNPLGGNIIGNNVVGGGRVKTDNIVLPVLKKIAYPNDKAYFWKIVIRNNDDKYFWLNQMNIGAKMLSDNYFSPNDTI